MKNLHINNLHINNLALSVLALLAVASASASAPATGFHPIPAQPVSSAQPAPARPALEQTTWTLTRLEVGGKSYRLEGTRPITVIFKGGNIMGLSGCNDYGAPFLTNQRTGSLRVGNLYSSAVDCGLHQNQLGNQYLAAFREVNRYQLRGQTLTLLGKNGVRLSFAAQPGPIPAGENRMNQPDSTATLKDEGLKAEVLVGDWQIVSLHLDGHAVGLDPHAALSLATRVSAEQPLSLTGTAGCNRLSAQGHLQAGALSFGPVASTRMLCGDMRGEEALLKLLGGPLTVRLNAAGTTAQMTWQGSAGEMVLRRKAVADAGSRPATDPAPGLNLDGQTFALQTINGEAPAVRGITLGFSKGQLSGKDGCNRYFGAYQLAGDQLVPGQIGSTLMACPDLPDSPSIEKFLQQRPRLVLRGNFLTLSAGGETWLFARSAGRLP